MLYPLKFHPILKEKVWGGQKLNNLLGKSTDKSNIGESWEISTVGADVSIVSNGKFIGMDLISLIKKYKGELIGNKVYNEFGDQFPLLIKFIDAKEDLSVQLHPGDELAKKRHNSFGKTEMWYVMQADKEAKLIVGFNKETSKEEYESYLEDNKIEELLNIESISKGDSYFINAGRIHAICGGSLIAEIQQTSDITYRVHDWNRKDNFGNTRELHTEQALEALNYRYSEDFKLFYDKKENVPNKVASCRYFNTNYIKITKNFERVYKDVDSFKIFLCIKGEGDILIENYKEKMKVGDVLLIPAIVKSVFIKAKSSGIELLEVYIN